MSAIGFGAEPLGGTDWGDVDLDAVRDAVVRALDLGVNVFDTADIYGLGLSEQRLGDALGKARKRVRIVSKGGLRWSTGEGRATVTRDGTAPYLRSAVDASLRRLGIEQIPLYLLHWPDPNTPLDESIDALSELQKAGLIGGWGLSNHTPEDIARAIARGAPSAIEVSYNAVDNASEAAIALAHRAGLEVLSYGALAQGLLTGKYSRGATFDRTDRRHRLPHFRADSPAWRTADAIRAIAHQAGRAPSEVAIRWVLEDPRITCVIAGAKSAQQVEENLASAASWPEGTSVRNAVLEWLAESSKESSNERRADG
jgi:aryl-alcohol dehydrogenase-like predicted oxidoreductase